MNMRYNVIRSMDISNGPGIRVSLFTQGCIHCCKNCFNGETWDYTKGKPWTEDTNNTILKLMNRDEVVGLSILGGDPFLYYDKSFNKENEFKDYLYDLVKKSKELYPQKDIWVWTGYLFENLINEDYTYTNLFRKTMENIDVIIDGPYIDELKNLKLKYAGSSNQRIIHINDDDITVDQYIPDKNSYECKLTYKKY